MPKFVIEVSEGIDEDKIKFWIAEGMGRELFKLLRNLKKRDKKLGRRLRRNTLRKIY